MKPLPVRTRVVAVGGDLLFYFLFFVGRQLGGMTFRGPCVCRGKELLKRVYSIKAINATKRGTRVVGIYRNEEKDERACLAYPLSQEESDQGEE